MLLGSPHCLSTGTSGLCLPGPLYAHLPILCHNCVVHSCTFKRECWNAASWRTQFCFPFKSCMQCNCICLHQFAPLFGLFDTLWLCCNVCDFWGFNSVIHAAAAAGKPGILAVFAEDFLTERWGEDSEAGTSWILARTGKHWVGHLSTFVCLEVRVCCPDLSGQSQSGFQERKWILIDMGQAEASSRSTDVVQVPVWWGCY